jgi:hypothetical protein
MVKEQVPQSESPKASPPNTNLKLVRSMVKEGVESVTLTLESKIVIVAGQLLSNDSVYQ